MEEEYLNLDSNAIEIHGKHYRIFCMNCYKNKLIECECVKWTGSSYSECIRICGKWESNIKQVTNYNIYHIEWDNFMTNKPGLRNICLQHPFCIICNFHQKNDDEDIKHYFVDSRDSVKFAKKLSKCTECGHHFCALKRKNYRYWTQSECGIHDPENSVSLCLNCIEYREYNIIYQTLKSMNISLGPNIKISLGPNIKEIIASYSTGYVVFCCNRICNKEIFIKNRVNFYQQCISNAVCRKLWNRFDDNQFGIYSIIMWNTGYHAGMKKSEFIDRTQRNIIQKNEYYYYPITKKRRDSLFIYGEQIRIFCRECAVSFCVCCQYETEFIPSCGDMFCRYIYTDCSIDIHKCNNREIYDKKALYPMCMEHRYRKLYKTTYPYFCVLCKSKVSIGQYNWTGSTCTNCGSFYCLRNFCSSRDDDIVSFSFHPKSDALIECMNCKHDNIDRIACVSPYDNDKVYRKTIKPYNVL